MRKGIEFLIIQSGIIFLILLFLDYQYITKALLSFIIIAWTWLVSIQYAIITRKEVDCRCFEVKEE